MRHVVSRWLPVLFTVLVGHASSARADDDRESDKATARELFHDAGKAMKAGDYETAAELYGRSNVIYPAPTAALGQARALVKLGKLLSAAERYTELLNTDLGDDPPRAFLSAFESAERERALILPRVPKLVVILDGEAEIRLDGETLPEEALGIERLVNPGKHVVSAYRGDEELTQREVTVAEGKTLKVQLSVPPPSAAEKAAAEANDARSDGSTEETTGQAQRITGYALLGLGGAATLAFAISGGLYLKDRSTVDEQCDDDDRCTAAGLDAVDRTRTMGAVNTASLVIALVSSGAGLTLVLTAPDDDHAAMAPVIGPGFVGVRGRF